MSVTWNIEYAHSNIQTSPSICLLTFSTENHFEDRRIDSPRLRRRSNEQNGSSECACVCVPYVNFNSIHITCLLLKHTVVGVNDTTTCTQYFLTSVSGRCVRVKMFFSTSFLSFSLYAGCGACIQNELQMYILYVVMNGTARDESRRTAYTIYTHTKIHRQNKNDFLRASSSHRHTHTVTLFTHTWLKHPIQFN